MKNKLWDKLRRKIIRRLGGIPKEEFLLPKKMVIVNLKPVKVSVETAIGCHGLAPYCDVEKSAVEKMAQQLGMKLLDNGLLKVEKRVEEYGTPTVRIRVNAWIVPAENAEEVPDYEE